MARPKLALHIGRRKFSVAHLVAALAAMFILLPFSDLLPWGNFAEAVLFTCVLIAAVNAVGARRHTLVVAILLVVPAILMRWLNHIWPGAVPPAVAEAAAFVFVVYVIVHLLRFVMTAPSVNEEVLWAAVSVYILFAVAWSFLYTIVGRLDPSAFVFTLPVEAGSNMVGFTAIYFSLVALTTIGFGDIVPFSNIARMLVLLEAVTGLFYMTILIARLVSLYSSGKST